MLGRYLFWGNMFQKQSGPKPYQGACIHICVCMASICADIQAFNISMVSIHLGIHGFNIPMVSLRADIQRFDISMVSIRADIHNYQFSRVPNLKFEPTYRISCKNPSLLSRLGAHCSLMTCVYGSCRS